MSLLCPLHLPSLTFITFFLDQGNHLLTDLSVPSLCLRQSVLHTPRLIFLVSNLDCASLLLSNPPQGSHCQMN